MTTASPVSGFGGNTTKLAILALAIGSFGIGTGEFAIMGLLPKLAREMLISEPEVGHVISAYALGVVVGAPLFAVLFAKAPRKPLMLWLMGLFALGNFGSAMAPDYLSLIGLRFVAGLPHGAYFGIAALIAASMVEVGYRARAVGRVVDGRSRRWADAGGNAQSCGVQHRQCAWRAVWRHVDRGRLWLGLDRAGRRRDGRRRAGAVRGLGVARQAPLALGVTRRGSAAGGITQRYQFCPPSPQGGGRQEA